MDKTTAGVYKDFIKRFGLLLSKYPDIMTIALSNIFTMRLIGNKTHGDLAEIAIAEFINQYMYDFKSVHVGKDLYRAKRHEEDIKIINQVDHAEFPVSIKAYGDGPLQLSTDKNFSMFPCLQKRSNTIQSRQKIKKIFRDPAFDEFSNMNVLPLIYDEVQKKCNIMIFDYELAKRNTAVIKKESEGKRRKHPVYRFYDKQGNYICEVRCGNAAANALQRGLWTHTRKGLAYFVSITNGWVSYSHNLVLVQLFSHALVSSKNGHEAALKKIKEDIELLREQAGFAK